MRLAPTRRRLGACGLAVLLAACAAPGADGLRPLAATRVADGVYAFIGSTGEASPENGGEVGNGGFVVGPSGTVMINTGSSYREGRRMIAAAERTGGRPVVLAIVLQPLQEFVMGSAAFEERGIAMLSSTANASLIGQRCERCLLNLQQLLGPQAMQGTRVIVPGRSVAASGPLEAGGRRLQLLLPGRAQTPGDVAVIDEQTGVLFAGGLVSIGRVPELRDADVPRWRQVLVGELAALRFGALVPGYGPVGDRQSLRPMTDYLDALEQGVSGQLRAGAGLGEAVTTTRLPAFEGWAGYASIHPRNVQQTYLRLEGEAFGR